MTLSTADGLFLLKPFACSSETQSPFLVWKWWLVIMAVYYFNQEKKLKWDVGLIYEQDVPISSFSF